MTTISANIIKDSISPDGIRLTTMHLRYPRFIHAEFMTHRVFSRNARSSRAVPVERMIDEVVNDPVIPLHWGKNQKGMQADKQTDTPVGIRDTQGRWNASREDAWLMARDHAVEVATAFAKAGYHKQIVNRLLEPFMHIDTLVTATDWENFIFLRDHKDAEPHIRILAQFMRGAMDESKPTSLRPGEWHLPYITQDDRTEIGGYVAGEPDADGEFWDFLKKISVARCARISYTPFDGNGSIEAELARYDSLVGSSPLHASPAEHQATPDIWIPARKRLEAVGGWEYPEQHANFRGWRQYRKMLANEAVPG